MKREIVDAGIVSDGKYIHQKLRNEVELISRARLFFKETYEYDAETDSEIVYCLYHEVSPSKCLCGNPTSYVNFKTGYRKHCSTKCSGLDPESREKVKQTSLAKYGVDNPAKLSEFSEKKKNTMLEKYGVDNPMKSAELKEKAKNTSIERYGVDHAMKNSDIRTKAKRTSVERYGVEYPMQSEMISAKAKTTAVERYGVEYPIQAPEVLSKAKATLFERYGVENAMQATEVRQKAVATWNSKYGICNQPRLDVFADHDYFEAEIAAFLKELGAEYISRTRSIISPYELDFYIETHRLAIEFNGLYWHSHERLNDRNYHLKKLIACQEKGIRLVSINEDEWIARSCVVKNKIRNIVGKSVRGVPARKTKIEIVPNSLANEFVEKYHLQGSSSGVTTSFGAFHDGNLISVMQFSRQRGTGKIELIRFCTDEETHAGLFSKMFSYAVSSMDYDHVISFADRRYSSGDVYQKNGFEYCSIIPPDYRYTKNNKSFHKSSFSKSRIEKKFNKDMSNLTERQAMLELGFRTIYDCGKIKFEWNKNVHK